MKTKDSAQIDSKTYKTTIDKDMVTDKLKKFRLDKSREEKVKAYYIFNNKQMDEVLEKMPKDKEELKGCSGFGDVKVEKYGDGILEALWN